LLRDAGLTAGLVASALLAVLYFRCFALMHDAVHRAVVDTRSVNHLVGVVMGGFCLLPYWPWRELHLEHHGWAGNVDRDPVMRIMKDYPGYTRSKKRFLDLCWQSWLPLLAAMQYLLFWSECLRRLRTGKPRDRLWNTLSLVVPMLMYAGLLWSATAAQLAWLGLSMLAYLAMVEVVNFPHHLGLSHVQGERRLPAREQYSVCRSCRYPSLVSYLCLNNFNLHSEHHMYPQLPWYALQQLSASLRTTLGMEYNHSNDIDWILQRRGQSFGEVITTRKPP
jgi:fatty acid desaturase